MKHKLKNFIAVFLFLVALLAFIVCASNITMPKRYELGANWGAFAAEEKNSLDVIFLGSSLAYCNVMPSAIWEESGISSYVMAGPEQITAMTYYYAEEIFRTQNPSALMVECSSVHYDSETGIGGLKANIGYMPYNLTRLKAIFNVAPKEERLGLIFPLYNYHDRWTELTQDDLAIGLQGYDADMLAGYHFLDRTQPQEGTRQRNFEQTQEEYEENIAWLQKIADLCREKGTRCIFYISGSYAYFEEGYLEKLKADLTADTGAEFLNCMDYLEEMELEGKTDFHDILHFNHKGAEKYSRWLGQTLLEMGITPAQPYADQELWQERSAYLDGLIQGEEEQ